MLTSPDKFASSFNDTIPGAYRRITALDVLNMKSCGLIGRSSYYGRADLETVRCILLYEQMREKPSAQQESAEDNLEPLKCKMCGQSLPLESENKAGRPKEYCFWCESFRIKERKKKSRSQRSKHYKPAIT